MPSEKSYSSHTPPDKMRLDKWLWCARFFKSRSLATQAVESGKVKLNAQRVKPARDIAPGDHLSVQGGELSWQIEVLALSLRRGAASVAQTLYREEEASIARRQQQITERKAAMHPDMPMKGRPTKRDRRQIIRFVRA